MFCIKTNWEYFFDVCKTIILLTFTEDDLSAKQTFIPKHLELGSWNFEIMFTSLHLLHVTCHMSPVTGHLSPVTCHMSLVPFFSFFVGKFVKLVCGVWRVSYQRGLPHLVFLDSWLKISNFVLLLSGCWGLLAPKKWTEDSHKASKDLLVHPIFLKNMIKGKRILLGRKST